MKVLIADDSAVMRKIIVRHLTECDIVDVVEAANVEEAVRLVAETRDLALTILDASLAEDSISSTLRLASVFDGVAPVLLVVTQAGADKLEGSKHDFIIKPFTADELGQRMVGYGF